MAKVSTCMLARYWWVVLAGIAGVLSFVVLVVPMGAWAAPDEPAEPAATAATIVYVKPVASGLGNGTSWSNATTLPLALSNAVSGTEIWVAQGVYRPTVGVTRTATFRLKNNVALYGGFPPNPANGSGFGIRNWRVYPAILSGDLDANDGVSFTNNSQNSFHVVMSVNADPTAVLDGFVVTGGNANVRDPVVPDACAPTSCGGGMYNFNGSPTVRNVRFTGNAAIVAGGMANIAGDNPSNARVTNSSFIGNKADTAGGIVNFLSHPILINVLFSGNTADAIGGGGIYNHASSPSLTNVTFSGNRSASGGGIRNVNGSKPSIRNSIFWGNTAPLGPQIRNSSAGDVPTITTSLVQGSGGSASWDANVGVNGGGNLDANPLFVSPVAATVAPTTTGNYRLLAGSPAANTGNNAFVSVFTDPDGNPRIWAGVVDMGAYERLLPRWLLYLPAVRR